MADNLKIAGLRLVIEGAAQFNSTITQINNQVKLSSAEFEKLQAQYGKSGKSVEVLAGKQKLLQDKLQATKDIGAQYNRILEETTAKYGEHSNEADKVRIAIAKNEAEQAKLEKQLEAVSRQLQIQSSEWTQFGQKCEVAGKKLKTIGDELAQVGQKMTTRVTLPIAAAGTAAAKAAVDFESAFAGVAKTVDATDEELAQMSEDIRQMAKDIPATTTEIAGVAEAAGQLGIATEDVMGFTRVMIDLGNSTNLSATEAASALAKFANITGMAASDYDRLGSVIVALGNNFATTEADIVAMSTRLASAGTLAGLTETEIMALATAMSSVGIEAEAGGTAMTQTMTAIESAVASGSDKVEEFARIAGMSADQFTKNWNEKPIEAITAFIAGLGELDEQGESATLVLEKLGLTGVRQGNMLKSLALASDMLTDAVDMSSQAWKDNTALAEESAKRYETMASRLQVMKNNVKDVGITLGEILMPYIEKAVEKIQQLTEWFSNLDEKQQENIVRFAAVAAAIGPILLIVGKLTSGIGSIVSVIGSLSTAIGAASAGGTALSAVFTAMTGPIGIVVAAVAALAAAFVGLFQTDEEFRAAVIAGWEEVKSFFSELWTQISDIFSAAFELIKTIVQQALENIKEFWDKHGEAITLTVNTVWTVIKTVIETVLTAISGIIKAITQAIQGDWKGAWETIKTTAATIWENIKTNIGNVIENIKTAIHNKLEEIKTKWTDAWNNVKTTLSNAGASIKQAVQDIITAVKNKFQEIINSARSWGQNLIQGFINGIRDKIAAVRDAAASVVSAAKDFLGFNSPAKKGDGRYIEVWGANFVKGFIDGMKSMMSSLRSAASSITSAAMGSMGSASTDNRSYSYGGITVQNMVVRSEMDIKLIAQELYRLQVKNARGKGVLA